MTEEHRQLLNDFASWLAHEGQKPETIHAKVQAIEEYLTYGENYCGDADIYTVTKPAAEQYRHYLKNRTDNQGKPRYKKITTDNRIFCLRSFCRFLEYIGKSEPTSFTDKTINSIAIREEYRRLLAEYGAWCALKGYKETGIKKKIRHVETYMEHCEHHAVSIYGAGIREAEQYREYVSLTVNERTNTLVSPATVNNTLCNLRTFYQFLLATDRAGRNAFAAIDLMKEGEQIPKNILTIPQMAHLLKRIQATTRDDYKFKVIVEVIYATGARIKEIEALRTEDVNLEKGYIIIRDDKTRKDRYAPLHEYVTELLSVYLRYYDSQTTGIVFPHGRPGSLNKWVNTRLKKLANLCELPYVSCHGLRHCIATHLLQKGADIREVQEYLGHDSIQATEVYTRIFPDDLKNVVEKTHPREARRNHERQHRHGSASV